MSFLVSVSSYRAVDEQNNDGDVSYLIIIISSLWLLFRLQTLSVIQSVILDRVCTFSSSVRNYVILLLFTKFFPHNHSKEQLHNNNIIIRNWIALHNDNLKTIAKLRYQLRKDTFDSISNQLIISDQPEMKANFRIHSISALVVVLSTIGLELSTHIHALVVPSSLHRSCPIQLKHQNIFKGQKPQHHDTSSSYLFSVGSADIDIDHDVNNKSIQDERDQENQSLNKISISKNSEMEAPSIKRIISFAIPAIGVYLCNPLLSTIDTSTVGLFCGTLQQAALNPAVTI